MPLTRHIRRSGRYRYLLAALLGVLGLATLLGTALGAAAPAPAAPNTNCTLTVPANPLSAKGLATPYLLSATDPRKGACHQADTNQSAFVQATVLDPATGALSVYDPLVTDRGSSPAVPPVRPALPARAVVGIWFGFNADTLTLRGANGSLDAGRCVNGLGRSLFTQFAYCNAPAFFRAANAAEAAGRLVVPPLGTGTDGRPCPSTRDFGVVDQDQSDNVTTDYLATADGRTAQRTAAASTALPGAVSLLNGSDNLLLTAFVDPALGCTPYTAPDLADPGRRTTSLALDELQAARFQAAPIALVPVNDPMAQVNGTASRTKTNLYRAGVDMPALGRNDSGDPLAYCAGLATTGARRIGDDRQLFTAAASPQAGTNLFDFLTARLATSLTNLNCPGPPPAATTAPAATAPAPSTPAGTAAAPSAGTGGTAIGSATATAPPSSAVAPPPSATAIGTAATSPTASATVPATAPATAPVAGGVVGAATATPSPSFVPAVVPAAAVVPAEVVPVAAGTDLAGTGAKGSPGPYLGLGVSALLLGSAFLLLLGRGGPVRRPR